MATGRLTTPSLTPAAPRDPSGCLLMHTFRCAVCRRLTCFFHMLYKQHRQRVHMRATERHCLISSSCELGGDSFPPYLPSICHQTRIRLAAMQLCAIMLSWVVGMICTVRTG
ncbi:hypothetical protein BR93DRAFT_320341 [Coniochaeta sp. PMI_546]|nr:hypothetical protein BR93DRAFT_320341 [Coniochaeta sp. PMI_546]